MLIKFLQQILQKLVAPAAIVPLIVFAPSVHADEEAIELLNRMNYAVRQLNYTGTLVYLKNNTLSSLHINHNVVNG
ncbi:MAG: hypothetical protein L3J46_09695, partial [Kangiellaceae bacterium]|nr:hypothetical protein [Kangiellaceae bacterium]